MVLPGTSIRLPASQAKSSYSNGIRVSTKLSTKPSTTKHSAKPYRALHKLSHETLHKFAMRRPPSIHPAAKGVRQKEFGKKVTKRVTEASEKVTESIPKTKKSDRTPFAALLLRHPEACISRNRTARCVTEMLYKFCHATHFSHRSDHSMVGRPKWLSGPISRDTAILSLRYPISRDTFKGGQHSPKMVRYPPLGS